MFYLFHLFSTRLKSITTRA